LVKAILVSAPIVSVNDLLIQIVDWQHVLQKKDTSLTRQPVMLAARHALAGALRKNRHAMSVVFRPGD
jgi:hypothetical protein